MTDLEVTISRLKLCDYSGHQVCSLMSQIKKISTPYRDTDRKTYFSEKRRLQLELLNIQNWAIEQNKRVAIIFDGRDAAGKGSTIKMITENLMPKHFRIVEFGVPTSKESKNWFRHYEKKIS